jgi:hypothetical protein
MQGLEPSGLQFAKIMLLDLGHVGLTANPILLKDICRLMQPFLLEQRTSTSVCVFHHEKSEYCDKTDSIGRGGTVRGGGGGC